MMDRLPTVWPSASPVPRQPSMTAVAVRARRLRERRKNGVRLLTVEMNGSDLQALAKVAQQADPIVELTVQAVLSAAYGTHGGGTAAGTSGEAPNADFCAVCGRPGVLWKDLTPCSYGGKTFNAHRRCFEALTAGG